MNRNEIVDILKLIQADDHRTLGEVDVALWQTVIGHLDFADARAAVFARIGSPPDGSWTRPGHIKILAAEIAKDRWLRTNPAERNELGQLDSGEPVNEAAAPARAAAIGLFAGNAGQLGDPYDTCIHLPCPRCHAERDAYCTNPVTGRSARCPCLRRLKAADQQEIAQPPSGPQADREPRSGTGRPDRLETPATAMAGASGGLA